VPSSKLPTAASQLKMQEMAMLTQKLAIFKDDENPEKEDLSLG
jgi:hypothetical protein